MGSLEPLAKGTEHPKSTGLYVFLVIARLECCMEVKAQDLIQRVL